MAHVLTNWCGCLGGVCRENSQRSTSSSWPRCLPWTPFPGLCGAFCHPKALRHDGCKTLVLDLDETLIHTIDLNFYGQCGKVCHPQPLIALVPCTHRGKPVAPLRQDIRAKGLCMLSQTAEAGVVQLRPRHSTVMLRIWIQPCIPL